MLWEGLGGRVGLRRAKSPACWENLLVMEGGVEHGAPRGSRKEQGMAQALGSHGWLESPPRVVKELALDFHPRLVTCAKCFCCVALSSG